MEMEKALLSSEEIQDVPADDGSQGVGQKRMLHCAGGVPRALLALGKRTPIEASSQVLVTFRGVGVDERLVRSAQERASQLGLARSGGLHVLLSQSVDEQACTAIVRARIGARRFERCASAADPMLAMQTAFDALTL